jgi:predicted transcriptional regulator
MIESLISSKTRVRLLLKFFLNSNATAYLRSLEQEFGESSNAIRLELNRLEEAGLLISSSDRNKKIFQANVHHPLFQEIHNILIKTIGIDQVVNNVTERLGNVQSVWLIGDFSNGTDSKIIDLIVIGDVDKSYLAQLTEKSEKIIKRKIRYLLYDAQEGKTIDWNQYHPKPLLLWSQE